VVTTTRHYKDRTYQTHLLRRSYREDGKVKNETVGNLSHLPIEAIDLLRRWLAGERFFSAATDLSLVRSLPHGHVAAVLGTMRKLGLPALVDPRPSPQRDVVLGLIAQRVLEPASKLGTVRLWKETTLAEELALTEADEDDLYASLDWLFERQAKIESRLAKRHLSEGGMILYDLSSSYLEGTHCPLAKFGHSRDNKRGKLQIEYGTITDPEGRPVGIEVFPGNTGDPSTVINAVGKVKDRFNIAQAILVGDRGMLTSARIEALSQKKGMSWISALRAPQIQALVNSGSLQLSMFDQRNLAEITDPRYPGERLVVCMNPLLAEQRARKREDLLQATEAKLKPIIAQVEAGRLKKEGEIALRVGREIGRHKMGKHFTVDIADGRLVITRNQEQIQAEAALDGIYVVRTDVQAETLDSADVVRSYKRLSKVERFFRTIKSFDMQVRPVHHYSENRVRAHVFLCMLAYYVRWHMEQALAELLFKDEEPPVNEDPVLPARRSARAERKAHAHQLADGTEAHSWKTLLRALATLTRNHHEVRPAADSTASPVSFTLVADPTPLQTRAFQLLGLPVKPRGA
jgi:Transposase DDE domain